MISKKYSKQHSNIFLEYNSSTQTLIVNKIFELSLKPAQQERNAWYWKPSQLLEVSEVIDLKGETTTKILQE